MSYSLNLLEEQIDQICYSYYRYEIKNGMNQLESFVNELTELLDRYIFTQEQLVEIKKLLELILLTVENKDFLIAADLLKHELLKRILQAATPSA